MLDAENISFGCPSSHQFPKCYGVGDPFALHLSECFATVFISVRIELLASQDTNVESECVIVPESVGGNANVYEKRFVRVGWGKK